MVLLSTPFVRKASGTIVWDNAIRQVLPGGLNGRLDYYAGYPTPHESPTLRLPRSKVRGDDARRRDRRFSNGSRFLGSGCGAPSSWRARRVLRHRTPSTQTDDDGRCGENGSETHHRRRAAGASRPATGLRRERRFRYDTPWAGCDFEPLRHDPDVREALFSIHLLHLNRIEAVNGLAAANTKLRSHLTPVLDPQPTGQR